MVSSDKSLLADSYNRQINYLRISVTDRCNLRCVYCMPENGIPNLRHEEILSYEELLRCARVAVNLGIRKIRITGGEPLIRKGIVSFIEKIARIDGITDLALTTNGTQLKAYARPLKEAGLHRVNVSMDTLRRDRYLKITRRDMLHDVLDGIHEAEKIGLLPLKINIVTLRETNYDEICDFARLTLSHPYIVRFIEFMPMGNDTQLERTEFVPGEDVVRAIRDEFPLERFSNTSQNSSVSRLFQIPGALGRIGVITPLTEHFCHMCNRLRITPNGHLRTCLFNDVEVDLKTTLRSGCSDKDLEELLRRTVAQKPSGHHLSRGVYRKCNSNMSRIGG